MNCKIVQVQTEHDIDTLAHLVSTVFATNVDVARLKSDFEKGFFNVYMALDSSCSIGAYSSDSILAFVAYYNSYSTWQDRVVYITHIWYSNLDVLGALKTTLFTHCRQNGHKRINVNVKCMDENAQLASWLLDNGAVDLSLSEDWLLFELGRQEMQSFLDRKLTLATGHSVIKIDDMSKYCKLISGLIRELSVFESMEDQCQITCDALTRDYEYVEHVVFNNNMKYSNRFYEAMVVTKPEWNDATQQTEEVMVGYAIYYFSYEMERGRGCYLEDLYIREASRHLGLGTYLWRSLIEDSLRGHGVSFMQWSVLAWNKPAIDFYKKFSAIDITTTRHMHILRFPTEVIYKGNL